ncbi:T23E18.15 [Salix viminalis]|uniref:T23E18.15 n=1 Tax=Salix viminalis TaxID=40686 RepID=A0A9Q0UUX1_SALVM|nr:T23E18.15 [Salix viminalis]
MAACHVRSISLPSRSHPLNASVEDQLDRLRSSLTTSTSAYHKLTGLKDLYECVEDFLQLPSTQQTLSNEQQKERGEEVLNGSLLLLDMCSTTRDVFSSMKECLQELESSLRRRKGGESGFSSESTEKNIASAVDAVSMLREVRETSLEIFQSLLSFVSQSKGKIKLPWLSSKDINPVQVQNVLKGLVALESDIQEAEEELEASYRKLLKTRVTILNILSH